MIVGFVKEQPQWEKRVALVPEVVHRLKGNGHVVIGERGAGERAGYTDEMYKEAGAELTSSREVYAQAELVAKIWAPAENEEKYLTAGQWIAADFESLKYPERLEVWQRKKIKALALERLPRLSRVQDIDVLSSQSNLAGYKAATAALNMLGRSVPLMMTAAGTLAPAKALVIGAGVAGLQAIATLQRMGALTYGADIRGETGEQVVSLGARFITATKENLKEILPQCEIVITAATSVSGKPSLLIDGEMLQLLPKDAVAVDLAAGNIAGAENGRIVRIGKATVWANTYLAADVAHSASFLYANNIYHLVTRWHELENDAQIWPEILISGKEARK